MKGVEPKLRVIRKDKLLERRFDLQWREYTLKAFTL